eukprot:comp20239_c1_seq1/m.25251 comp20239_c1_seq1/g.25251  ORF comp20239_c1_seq1/g.25251 comp20239_c1_seq1/m.25251 type:complete len:638 (-) comp20239_c1_seq1:114-2027(-)
MAEAEAYEGEVATEEQLEEGEYMEDMGHGEGGHERGVMIGPGGSDYIRANLLAADPIQFIEDFQRDYGLDPVTHHTVSTAIPLLDVMNISRVKIYKQLLGDIKTQLMARLDKVPTDMLNDLLSKSFTYIGQAELADVPMELLRRHPDPPPELLEHISSNPQIYQSCPMEVKQKVWLQEHSQEAQKLFREQVFGLLTKFINDKEILESANILSGSNKDPRSRRKHPAIVRLVEVVGRLPRLYDMVVRFLHRLFLSTKNRLFCTLRADLLMALFDADVPQIYETDRCHKFVWCLDSCKRARTIDRKRIEEMQGFFSNTVNLDDPIIKDIAMIIIDPFTAHMFIQNTYDYLVALVDKHEMPKGDDKIRYLTQIVGLGLCSHQLIENESYEIPPCDEELMRQAMPTLVSVMVDDAVRQAETQLGKNHSKVDALPQTFLAKLETSEILQKLVGLYLVSRSEGRDAAALQRLLGAINGIALDATVFDTLQALILHMDLDESTDPIRQALLEGFFVPASKQGASQHLRVVHLARQLHKMRPLADLQGLLRQLTETGMVDSPEGDVMDHRTQLAKAYSELLADVSPKAADSLSFVATYVQQLEGPDEEEGEGEGDWDSMRAGWLVPKPHTVKRTGSAHSSPNVSH